MSGSEEQERSFERLEGARDGEPATTCKACGTPIRHVYFKLNDEVVCAPCKSRAVEAFSGGSPLGRFARAAGFGALAAAGGALLWYAIGQWTGREFGLIAVVVGLMVGGAVRWGCRRRGGWAYQALAMFLTYASIVSTYIPQIVEAVMERDAEAVASAGEGPGAEAEAAERTALAAETQEEDAAADKAVLASEDNGGASRPTEEDVGLKGVVLGAGALLALAFIAPFLGGFENFLGWVILAIALYEAWKLNRRGALAVEGPFRLAGSRPEYVPETPPPPIQP